MANVTVASCPNLSETSMVAAINSHTAALLKHEENCQNRHEELLEALWGAAKFMVRF